MLQIFFNLHHPWTDSAIVCLLILSAVSPSRTLSQTQVPSQVNNIQFIQTVSNGMINLRVTWNQPTSDRPIQHYEVQYKKQGVFRWTSVTPNPTTRQTTINNVDKGSVYNVQVRGVSDVGSGQWRSVTSQRTYRVPSQVSNIQFTQTVSNGMINLEITWDQPISDRPIQYYEVQYRKQGVSSWTSVTPNPTTRQTTIRNVDKGSVYNVQVRAVSDVGSGQWRSATSPRIYRVPGAPTNLMISPPSGSCDQLMVTWTAPSNTGGLPVKYKVYRDGTLIHSMRTTTTTTWSGLTANTQYTVRVVAFNDLGDGGNVTGTGRTRPKAPSISSLSANSSTQLIITLTAPARSSSLTYKCTISTTVSGLSPKTVTGTVLQYTVDGLSPYVTYTVECTSSNGEDSCDSNMDTIRMLSDAPSGPPLNLVDIRSRTNTLVTLSWDPPEEKDRNGIITGYDVKHKPTDDSAEEISKEVEGTNVVISNLIACKKYIFMVAAKTSKGIGPYVDNGLEKVPGKVVHLRRGESTGRSVTIMWDSPQESEDYETLEYLIRDGIEGSKLKTGCRRPRTSVTLSNLVNGVPYEIRVSAATNGGEGEESRLIFFLKQLAPIRAVNASTIKTAWSGNSLNIRWEPLSLHETRGFPVYYIYLNDSSGPIKREIEPTANATESSLVIDGLDSSQTFMVAIGVATDGGNIIGPAIASESVVEVVTFQSDLPVGLTIGLLLGGALIGVICGVGVICIVCKLRLTKFKKREISEKKQTEKFEEDLKVKYKVPLDIVKIEANPAYDAIHVSKKEET